MQSLTSYALRGYDIDLYEQPSGHITMDIKYPCGELLKGFTGIVSRYAAERMARELTHMMGGYNKQYPHCESEYCQPCQS